MNLKKILSAVFLFSICFLLASSVALAVDPSVGSAPIAVVALSMVAGFAIIRKAYGGDLYNMACVACGQLASNIGANCGTNLTPGVHDTIYLFNHDDIAGYTETSSNLVTAISLSGMALGFSYQGKLNSALPKCEMVPKSYANLWKHSIEFRVFDWTAATKDEIDQMAAGRIVAVVINNAKTLTASGDLAIEIYGREAGMYLEAGIREAFSADNAGAFVLTLASRDNNEEGHPPTTFLDTDYDTTKTLLDTYITP